MVIFGGLPLVLATLGFTFLGEGLRDHLDPRLKVAAAVMSGALQARDLSVRYETPQGSVHALRHVDLEAQPGRGRRHRRRERLRQVHPGHRARQPACPTMRASAGRSSMAAST